ncbi:hypothetical protein FLJC2902T_24820 [Flavobacterium limnosediminis JC2902]|uniref:Uncharacterized protein n=1 Tax=Flavobacterium limnosediminis JC2902 TaxID=1341181 RepID=V6SIU3_9FLAO|nr:hypothetical protein [Flavobacterium limnosediminis]ESU26511.1 hypothetical protein FLJC2902T_24820 [Flavobacterium limnosediminis JC2902]
MKTHLVFAATLIVSTVMQAQKLEQPKQLLVEGSFCNPVVSPDGKYALLTKEHSQGVYLLDVKASKVRQISDKAGSGYAYSWNQNSTTFYFRTKNKADYHSYAKVASYDVKARTQKKQNSASPNWLPSFKGFEESTIVVYTNLTTLKIEAKDLKTQKSWVITNDEGQFYNALLSNDGKKIAVHKGADIYIYAIDGKSKGIKIGTGIATSWSKNDKYLIGFMDESKDGHTVSNSDLFLFDVASLKKIQLTSTEDRIEMFPCFYGDNKIMFSDDKTGKIYVSKLKI